MQRLARCLTAKRTKFAGLNTTLKLGGARYDLAPGASKTLKVKVATGSRRLAGANGRLKVRVIASPGPSGEIARSSQRLALELGRATKRKR